MKCFRPILFIFCYLLLTTSYLLSALPVMAIYDPLSVSNNRVGVHILSPDEIESAAKLVNNDGKAAWGYVTVPIQATDRDRDKWTRFMKKATELKIIPIIRVATAVENIHWEKPEDDDLIDFANFLNDLPWPTPNRYVIIFNEVNRADEYGGKVDPENYADILANAIEIFKRRSDKFFILPSALDNAAPNAAGFLRFDTYLTRMRAQQPEIFNQIDGWNSHAYGNPGFSTSPALSGSNKADSFKSDLALLNRFTKRKLPVFITEAGWSNKALDDRTIATFYNHAFYNAWASDQVVAVTPFLLFAGAQPFSQFSLLTRESRPTLAYQTIQSFAVGGQPPLENYDPPRSPAQRDEDLAEARAEGEDAEAGAIAPEATSTSAVLGQTQTDRGLGLWQKLINFFTGIFKKNKFIRPVTVGQKEYLVEVVVSEKDLAVGLAKYDRLEPNQGMLFDLKSKYIPTFWMKDMKFDIDLIWIGDDKVVYISQGFANNPTGLIRPKSAVNYVLELNLNSGVKIGDQVTINK